MRVAVIGAGAAGCFCAIELRRRLRDAEVTVFEAAGRPLAKVAVTGGGRCNLTNSFAEVRSLASVYPRGESVMKRGFRRFSNIDACRWFEGEGVRLVTQDDQCVFPQSQDAMQIVRTLLRLMDRHGVALRTSSRVTSIRRDESSFEVCTSVTSEMFDRVVVTTGGSPKLSGISFLDSLELEIEQPVPSLFTFKIKDKSLTSMMGAVVEDATVAFCGTKFKAEGPLLVTDWGVSGPAVLKLSSHAARWLAGCGYRAPLSVNWMGTMGEQEVRDLLQGYMDANPQKQVCSIYPRVLTSRLWSHLLMRAQLREGIRWAELGKKGFNRLVNVMINDVYDIDGRGQFKDEFVTCGGVSLSNIDLNTLESKKYPGLYFAGEVLDIDAVTGGFNLQAAWTTGYIVACSISQLS